MEAFLWIQSEYESDQIAGQGGMYDIKYIENGK